MFNVLKELLETKSSVNLYDWTLREVLLSGEITNHYQTTVIAQLTQFFADDPTRNIESLPLSGAVISQELRRKIEGLDSDKLEELVKYLLDCLQNDISDHDSCPLAWIQLSHAIQK